MILPPIKDLPKRTEFYTELLGIAAGNPYTTNNSPARQQMYLNGHLAQKLVIRGMSENFQNTFVDDALGKSTFNVKIPVRAVILKIIDRYPVSDAAGSIAMNPERLVIYESVDDKKIGVMVVPRYLSFHSYFGFELVPTVNAHRLVAGTKDVIEAGTVFFDSPGKTHSGRYMSGVMLNTAFMGHPATSEDGIVICRDVLPTMRHKRYEVRSMEWGEDTVGLNLYGDENNYKLFPDIGEYVRDDGLLMVKRDLNTRYAPMDLSVNGLRNVDYIYDECLYAKGKGGRVVDIKVTLNYDYIKKGLGGTNQQLDKYVKARNRYNQTLIDEYNRLKRVTHGNVQVTPELHVLIKQAMVDQQQGRDRFQKTYRNVPIDHFRVDFVVEYEVEPCIGFKVTGIHAEKGVICYIAEPHEMPVDKYGRRADIMIAAESRTNRMNSGGLHEMYYNDASWHVRRRVLAMLGLDYFEGITLKDRTSATTDRERKCRHLVATRIEWLKKFKATNLARLEEIWDFVVNYYRRVAPLQAHVYDRHDNLPWDAILSNLATIVEDFTYLEMPPDFAPNYLKIAKEVKEHVGFERGPVTYMGYSGKPALTDSPVRIAAMRWILLEKVADSWSAVSIGKVQLFGFLAQLSHGDKYANPGRRQHIKAMSETEFRIVASTCGQRACAEIADRNNSQKTQKIVHRSIMTSFTPGNIMNCVNRNVTPFGTHQGVQILHHFLNCGGIALKYAPEQGT